MIGDSLPENNPVRVREPRHAPAGNIHGYGGGSLLLPSVRGGLRHSRQKVSRLAGLGLGGSSGIGGIDPGGTTRHSHLPGGDSAWLGPQGELSKTGHDGPLSLDGSR